MPTLSLYMPLSFFHSNKLNSSKSLPSILRQIHTNRTYTDLIICIGPCLDFKPAVEEFCLHQLFCKVISATWQQQKNHHHHCFIPFSSHIYFPMMVCLKICFDSFQHIWQAKPPSGVHKHSHTLSKIEPDTFLVFLFLSIDHRIFCLFSACVQYWAGVSYVNGLQVLHFEYVYLHYIRMKNEFEDDKTCFVLLL